MPRNTLKKLGLSDNEVQVYLTTLSLGQALVSTIANKCGIKRTSCYAVIEKLSEKGFLTSFTQKGTKYYCAVDPEVLADKCKQEVSSAQNNLRDIEKIIPFLENLQADKDSVKVEYFEGFEGMKNMLENVLIENKPVLGILSVHNICQKMNKYIQEHYAPKRNQQITNESKVIFLEQKQAHNYMQTNYDTSKFSCITINESEFPLKTTIQIYGSKVAFYVMNDEKNLHGILIESPLITETMKAMFLQLWKSSKK